MATAGARVAVVGLSIRAARAMEKEFMLRRRIMDRHDKFTYILTENVDIWTQLTPYSPYVQAHINALFAYLRFQTTAYHCLSGKTMLRRGRPSACRKRSRT
jgi:hypothetical protein